MGEHAEATSVAPAACYGTNERRQAEQKQDGRWGKMLIWCCSMCAPQVASDDLVER